MPLVSPAKQLEARGLSRENRLRCTGTWSVCRNTRICRTPAGNRGRPHSLFRGQVSDSISALPLPPDLGNQSLSPSEMQSRQRPCQGPGDGVGRGAKLQGLRGQGWRQTPGLRPQPVLQVDRQSREGEAQLPAGQLAGQRPGTLGALPIPASLLTAHSQRRHNSRTVHLRVRSVFCPLRFLTALTANHMKHRNVDRGEKNFNCRRRKTLMNFIT